MSDHEYEPGNHENILNRSDNQIENTKEQPKDDPLIVSTFYLLYTTFYNYAFKTDCQYK